MNTNDLVLQIDCQSLHHIPKFSVLTPIPVFDSTLNDPKKILDKFYSNMQISPVNGYYVIKLNIKDVSSNIDRHIKS
jgi:hypothetical protein